MNALPASWAVTCGVVTVVATCFALNQIQERLAPEYGVELSIAQGIAYLFLAVVNAAHLAGLQEQKENLEKRLLPWGGLLKSTENFELAREE